MQTYSDLDQSGLLKPPEFFGKSFLGQALVLLGNSLKDALGSSSAPIDTEVSGQPNSVLQASRDPKSRARSGSDLVPTSEFGGKMRRCYWKQGYSALRAKMIRTHIYF